LATLPSDVVRDSHEEREFTVETPLRIVITRGTVR